MAMLMVMTLDCSLDPHVSEACRSATQPKTQMLMVMTMAKQRQPLFSRSIHTYPKRVVAVQRNQRHTQLLTVLMVMTMAKTTPLLLIHTYPKRVAVQRNQRHTPCNELLELRVRQLVANLCQLRVG